MGILFTILMGILFTITIGILFTIVLGIQFTISKETPNISEEYLSSAIFYWNRLMMGIAIYAKIDQGINFEWKNYSEFIPGKDNPTLR